MATPQEIRNRRLSNDYKEMLNILGGMVAWTPIKGNAPHVEEYELTLFVRTIVSPKPEYREVHLLKVILPEAYPQAPPQVEFISQPAAYHPNWFKNGRWCYGTWEMSEGLGHHIVRLIRTLQYDLEITNEHSPANYEANDWFLDRKFTGIFPCDIQPLPDPTKANPNVQPPVKKFSIMSGENQPEPPKEENPQPKRGFRLG